MKYYLAVRRSCLWLERRLQCLWTNVGSNHEPYQEADRDPKRLLEHDLLLWEQAHRTTQPEYYYNKSIYKVEESLWQIGGGWQTSGLKRHHSWLMTEKMETETSSRRVRREGGIRGVQTPLFGSRFFMCFFFFFFFFWGGVCSLACQRGWSCMRIPLCCGWEIDLTFFEEENIVPRVLPQPPPPPPGPVLSNFLRAGAPSRPGTNCKTPPLRKSYVRHSLHQ